VAKAAPFLFSVYYIGLLGENMLNWLRRKISDYSRSPKWSSVRKEHLKHQPVCQACGRKDDLEVHHIIPYHKNPEKELDPNNLITLCSKNCHLLLGHLMDYKSWNENVVEDSKFLSSKIKNRPYNENFTQKPTTFFSFIFRE
jgi:hypothetical protein